MDTSCFAMLHYCFDVFGYILLSLVARTRIPLFHWCFVLVSLETEMFWLF